jgi:hypothetical protein
MGDPVDRLTPVDVVLLVVVLAVLVLAVEGWLLLRRIS